jgi:hypothetical protein
VIPQFLWIIGLISFVVVGIVLLIYALMLARQGDIQAVARAIGTRSAEEDIEEEIRGLKERSAGEESR